MRSEIKAIFLDLSGVLYEGEDRIEGALDMVKALREKELTLRFVTNTATKTNDEILIKLRAFGFELEENELFTAPKAAQAYVKANQLCPYAVVHDSIKSLFEIQQGEEPNCVVLGDAREGLSYPAMNRAFQICSQGAPLITIGYNRYFKKDDALWLDAGAFAKAIEWAANCEAIVAGKPGREFFNQVLASTELEAGNCLMVGDDIEGDVIGAHEAGLQACLVQTGKYQQEDAKRLPQAAMLVDSIAELPDLL